MLNYRMNCYCGEDEINGSFGKEDESLIIFDDDECSKEELLTDVFDDSTTRTEARQFSNKVFLS